MKIMKFNTQEILDEIMQEAIGFECSFDEIIKYIESLGFESNYKDTNIEFIYQKENVKILMTLDYEVRNFCGLAIINSFAVHSKKEQIRLDELTKRYIHIFIRDSKEALVDYKYKLEKNRLANQLLEKSMGDNIR
jgi:hypothetical protein